NQSADKYIVTCADKSSCRNINKSCIFNSLASDIQR
ncbi:MAG: hypothetical protein ACJA2O_002344, partial [Candidatus Azotimanducaceae bacterium]